MIIEFYLYNELDPGAKNKVKMKLRYESRKIDGFKTGIRVAIN